MTNEESSREATPSHSEADAVVGGALGWLFILVGSAAVAAAALIPGYFDTLDIQQARSVQEINAQMLAQERQRYVDFHKAIRDEDPVLLERLAMTELRLKPVGTQVASRVASDPLALVIEPSRDAIDRALAEQPLMRSVENELSRPDLKHQAVVEIELERPRRTRLVQAVMGENRPWVAGFGALLLMLGLWPRRAAE